MQLYKGLPIITNKITVPERRGIPHHLLEHADIDAPNWAVDDFKREATRVISEIRSRGKLPIVVGGTHYYINSILFEGTFVGAPKEEEPRSNFPILEEPTEVVLAKLREVDPIMAGRWHPNDRRKIQRSLEIYLRYGRPASEIYAEQKEAKRAADADSPWQNLMFWVYSDPEVLSARLDGRVDKMLDVGLMDEIMQMHQHVKAREAEGETIDFTRGIWQSIGFKEFQPYLRAADASSASDPAVEELYTASLEDMKASTRQYAKSQTRWIRTKTVPLLRDLPDAMDKLFVVDSTDVSAWASSVAEPAASITRLFLDGETTPEPASLSPAAARVLDAAVAPRALETVVQNTCTVCNVTCVTADSWEKHNRSKKHKGLIRRAKRRSLVVVDAPAQDDGEPTKSEINEASRPSSPDLQLGVFEQTSRG